MLRAVILGLAVLTTPAHAYLARNSLVVRDVGAGQYQVDVRGGLSAPAAWCAMGDYAIHILHLDHTTPIWRVSEPPRKQGEGIVFALSGTGAATKNGLLVFGATDPSLTAGRAQRLCWNRSEF